MRLNHLNVNQKFREIVEGAVEYNASPQLAEDDPEAAVELTLGILISHYAQWDGLTIMRIFANALEDSNFHRECEKVWQWVKAYEAL